MVEVNLILVNPFTRPAMMAISLPEVQALTETVRLMSGLSRLMPMGTHHGHRPLGEVIQMMVYRFNKQMMVDILLPGPTQRHQEIFKMACCLRQMLMETKNGIRTLVLAVVNPFNKQTMVAISLQVLIIALPIPMSC